MWLIKCLSLKPWCPLEPSLYGMYLFKKCFFLLVSLVLTATVDAPFFSSLKSRMYALYQAVIIWVCAGGMNPTLPDSGYLCTQDFFSSAGGHIEICRLWYKVGHHSQLWQRSHHQSQIQQGGVELLGGANPGIATYFF